MEPNADGQPTDETGPDETAEGESTPTSPKRRRGMIAAGVAFALVAVASIEHLHQAESPAPYQPAALQAKVALRASGDMISGRLQYLTPDKAPVSGQYTVIVIDNQTHHPTDVTGPSQVGGTFVRHNWDRRFDQVVSAVGAHGTGYGLSFAPNTPAPIAFGTGVAVGSTPPSQLGSRVTVVLAFFSADGRLYWTAKVPT